MDRYDELIDHEHKLIIREVNNEQAFFDGIGNTVTEQGRPLDVLFIAGHGSPDAVVFGTGEEENSRLDIEDREIIGAISQYFNNPSTIIFLACRTGEDEKPIAAVLANAFRGGDSEGEEKNITIIAPSSFNKWERTIFDNNNIKDIWYGFFATQRRF